MKQFVRLAVLIACFAAPAQAAPDKREAAIGALARQHPQSAIAAAVITDGKVSFTAVSGQQSPGGIGRWSAADDVYTTIGDYATFVSAVSRGDGMSPALAAERLRGQVDTQGCPKPVEGCPVDPKSLILRGYKAARAGS
jgi:hypothetical protein